MLKMADSVLDNIIASFALAKLDISGTTLEQLAVFSGRSEADVRSAFEKRYIEINGALYDFYDAETGRKIANP